MLLLVSTFYFPSLLQQREQQQEVGDSKEEGVPCPSLHTMFVKMGYQTGNSSCKAGVTNYSVDELNCLVGLTIEKLPIMDMLGMTLLQSK